MFYVYILLSEKDNKLYTGYTSNLKRRLSEHTNGQVDSTKSRRPLRLIMYEAYSEDLDARAREVFFKSTKGKVALRKQLRTFFENKPR